MVTSTVAWSGIGFPSTDLDLVGSDVIIGLPDDPSVLEYEVLGETAEEVVVFEQQDITEASVVQADGSTTLSFIRPLSPGGNKQNISYEAGDTTKFIFGQGADNDLGVISDVTWSGMRVDLYCGTGGIAALARTPAPTVVGGGTGETPAPVAAVADGETPAPVAAVADGETPAPVAAVADGETPAPVAAVADGETPAPVAAVADGETPAPVAAVADGETPAPVAAVADGETPAPVAAVADGETPAPVAAVADGETPAPTPADGDRGITTTDGETAAPTVEADGVPTTEGPTTVDEADGQGDADGAFHAAAGAGWAAMAAAATGVATVLAALSL
ncbi:unnamed protein product [Ectocarpus sp. CCAP 1310/34]|nr:unnamed protein product [Ectocarpus sp. CCAP 1310/34]